MFVECKKKNLKPQPRKVEVTTALAQSCLQQACSKLTMERAQVAQQETTIIHMSTYPHSYTQSL